MRVLAPKTVSASVHKKSSQGWSSLESPMALKVGPTAYPPAGTQFALDDLHSLTVLFALHGMWPDLLLNLAAYVVLYPCLLAPWTQVEFLAQWRCPWFSSTFARPTVPAKTDVKILSCSDCGPLHTCRRVKFILSFFVGFLRQSRPSWRPPSPQP